MVLRRDRERAEHQHLDQRLPGVDPRAAEHHVARHRSVELGDQLGADVPAGAQRVDQRGDGRSVVAERAGDHVGDRGVVGVRSPARIVISGHRPRAASCR